MNGSGARFSANANAFLTKKEKIVNLKWYESQFLLKKKLISMSYSCFYSEKYCIKQERESAKILRVAL